MTDWTRICALEDIPLLGSRVLKTEAHGKIAVFRTADNQVYALRDRCPHKGGPLSQGIVAGGQVTCPLHSWKLQLDSGQAVAPDVGCARRYDTRLEDGTVFIQLPAD